MSASARANPKKFYLGIDANAKPLEKLSTKITRKPTKGGLPNAMFIQAAVEDLPEEFVGIASEIYVNFPWGSLLRAVATGEPNVLASMRRILIPGGTLTITIGIDPARDRAELSRLSIPEISSGYINSTLSTPYHQAGFTTIHCRELAASEWPRIGTSWARKLGGNNDRRVFHMKFVCC